jgi:biopolymer transport protein ExbD
MRIPQRTAGSDLGVNMTPMIDVVFLLIIFFLLSNHLARREARLPLPLPTIARQNASASMAEGPLTVQVTADGIWQVGGVVVEQARLAELLRERVALQGATLPLRVRCDRSVAYERVEPILRTAAEQGIADVSLAVHGDR